MRSKNFDLFTRIPYKLKKPVIEYLCNKCDNKFRTNLKKCIKCKSEDLIFVRRISD